VFDEKYKNQKCLVINVVAGYLPNFIILEKIFERAKDLILKGNIDYFDKTIQFIYSPRILLGAVVLFWVFFSQLSFK
jgi:hypothetical protein